MFRVLFALLLILLALLAIHPACAGDTPPAGSPPPWLSDLQGAPDLRPRLTDPLGRRFVRRSVTGMALMPPATAIQVLGWVKLVWIADDRFTTGVGLTAAGNGLASGGALGTGTALERALVDLRYRGVPVSPTAARIGHVFVGLGVASVLAASAVMIKGDPHDRVPVFWISAAGSSLTLLSVVPYAIQTAQVRRAYMRLPQDPPRGATLRIAPFADPVSRTIGVTGTF